MACCSEPAHPSGQKRRTSVRQTEKDTAQVPQWQSVLSSVHRDFRQEPPMLTFQLAEQAWLFWRGRNLPGILGVTVLLCGPGHTPGSLPRALRPMNSFHVKDMSCLSLFSVEGEETKAQSPNHSLRVTQPVSRGAGLKPKKFWGIWSPGHLSVNSWFQPRS